MIRSRSISQRLLALSARPWLRLAVICGAALILVLLVWRTTTQPTPPSLSEHEDIPTKKAAFFDYLLPLVEDVNRRILADREKLLLLRAGISGGNADARPAPDHWFNQLAAHYRLDAGEEFSLERVDRLLKRVDIIAPSLALAQAATESGWGSSRFAREGHNYFGMRDYSGNGIVPERRPRGATWTVASYSNPAASVDSYIHNLNTHKRYVRLRAIRQDLRRQDAVISGYALARGLLAYSETGTSYVRTVQSIIRTNELGQYDAKRPVSAAADQP